MKRILPRTFPLTEEDWTEIYYCLSEPERLNIPADGQGMTDGRASRLSEKAWIEIYESVKDKRDALKAGFYGRDRLARDWQAHLSDILETLSPVAESFIGKGTK